MKKRKKEKKISALLLEDLPNLGQTGEIILIKPGHFKYLISQKKVVLANREKLRTELKPLLLEEKIKSREKEIQKLKEEIEKLVLELKVNQYVSVTKEKIIKALKEKGIKISKSQIELKEKIKTKGEYKITINLGYHITAQLRIKVN